MNCSCPFSWRPEHVHPFFFPFRPLLVLDLLVDLSAGAYKNKLSAAAAPFHVPDNVVVHGDISFEATRMSDRFISNKSYCKKLSTIIMALGWGVIAAYLDCEAVASAEAG